MNIWQMGTISHQLVTLHQLVCKLKVHGMSGCQIKTQSRQVTEEVTETCVITVLRC